MDWQRLRDDLEERIGRIKAAQGIARAIIRNEVEKRNEVAMSRSVRRFKSFAETLEKALDAHVETAIGELKRKHGDVMDAVTGVTKHIGKSYDEGKDDALDMLNQMTNGGPTDGDSGNSEQSSG